MALFHQIKRHDGLEEARRQQEKAFSAPAYADDGQALQRDMDSGRLAPKENPLQKAYETRGRKADPNAKKLLTLRIDPDVIGHFRATGEGWQTRMNEALRKAAGL